MCGCFFSWKWKQWKKCMADNDHGFLFIEPQSKQRHIVTAFTWHSFHFHWKRKSEITKYSNAYNIFFRCFVFVYYCCFFWNSDFESNLNYGIFWQPHMLNIHQLQTVFMREVWVSRRISRKIWLYVPLLRCFPLRKQSPQ